MNRAVRSQDCHTLFAYTIFYLSKLRIDGLIISRSVKHKLWDNFKICSQEAGMLRHSDIKAFHEDLLLENGYTKSPFMGLSGDLIYNPLIDL